MPLLARASDPIVSTSVQINPPCSDPSRFMLCLASGRRVWISPGFAEVKERAPIVAVSCPPLSLNAFMTWETKRKHGVRVAAMVTCGTKEKNIGYE